MSTQSLLSGRLPLAAHRVARRRHPGARERQREECERCEDRPAKKVPGGADGVRQDPREQSSEDARVLLVLSNCVWMPEARRIDEAAKHVLRNPGDIIPALIMDQAADPGYGSR